MPLPTIASLWIGRRLSFLEQVCLKSFLDFGHRTVLYTYGPLLGVPDGVEIRDANRILDRDNMFVHRDSGSSALHSDYFRYRMLEDEPVVWADADVLCMRPWDTDSPWFVGWEKPKKLICGAVLGLPRDSATLRALLDFCRDEYPIPPWASEEEQARLAAARDAGDPAHVSDLKWGVWGPAALTHFLIETGEVSEVLPQNAFYPIPFRDRRDLLDAGADIDARLGEGCLGVHLWNRRLRRRIVTHEAGIPHPDSFLGRALARHGIDPEAAPIPDEPPARVLRERRDAERRAALGRADPARAHVTSEPPAALARMPVAALRQSAPFQTRIDALEDAGAARDGWLVPAPVPPSSDEILVVTAMKNEGPFILEWIAYHLAIGVTHFLVYTNDCSDPTNAMLDRLEALGHVTRFDNPYDAASGEKPQHGALKDAVKRPAYKNADWVLTIDVDEFLNIHVGDGTIADFLEAANHPNVASFTWKFFGNGGVHAFEDRPIIEQFVRCAPEYIRKPRLGWGFKTMFRPDSPYTKIGVHRPLAPKKARLSEVRWVNGSGRVMPESILHRGWRSTTESVGYRLATLNHYVLRSADSYLVKRDRGRVNHTEEDQGHYYWMRRNYVSETDRRMLDRLPMMQEIRGRLLEDAELARLHDEAVTWHRERAAALKEIAEYRSIYEKITAPDQPDALSVPKREEDAGAPARPAPPDDPFAAARAIAYARAGEFRSDGVNAFCLIPGSTTLVVSFDDQKAARVGADRGPRGHDYLAEALGVSLLGVMANERNWFRSPFVWDGFDALRDAGFFRQYRKVLFTGAGMGGYAALAYAEAAPGADVLALSPQTTMDRAVVPGETRWKWTGRLDWRGPYRDGAAGAATAGRVVVVSDPYYADDRRQVARLDPARTTLLAAPFAGADAFDVLLAAGRMTDLVRTMLAGGLDRDAFARMFRCRRDDPEALAGLARRAEAHGHPVRARRISDLGFARTGSGKLKRLSERLANAKPTDKAAE